MVNYLLWISNVLHLDQRKRHIHTCTYTHTHIYTVTHICTHTYTHVRAYMHKHGVTLHILVSSISSEGAVYRHSDVFPDGATAKVHVTNFVNRCVAWRGHLIHSITLNLFFLQIFGGVKNWIFLKKDLSLEIVLEKRLVSYVVSESIKIVMSIEMYRKINKMLL